MSGLVEKPVQPRAEGLAGLRESFPWPSEQPKTGIELHGWFGDGNGRILARTLQESPPQIIIELGSWMGKSTIFLAEHAPGATILAVDHWVGSVEHHNDSAFHGVLPTLYDCFLQNLWEHRSRVVPVRRSTWEGLAIIGGLGVKPDLIYVDASHEEEDVLRDLQIAGALFPGARLVGDDWEWPSVRRAVRRYARLHGLFIEVDTNCWRLHRPADYAPAQRLANRADRARRKLASAAWPAVKRLRAAQAKLR